MKLNMRKKGKRIYTVSIIFLLTVIFIIIVGAFAQSKIYDIQASYNDEIKKSHVLNQAAQQNITGLMEENERLKQEAEKGDKLRDRVENIEVELSKYNSEFEALTSVWNKYKLGQYKDAGNMLKEIDKNSLNSNMQTVYIMMEELLKNKKSK